MSGNPEDLLRGALEKIVYFECRLAQLESELKAARDIALREKDGAATARERESAAVAELAQARSELASTRRRDEDLADRVRLLEGERERFLQGLIDQARIAGAPRGESAPGEEADLAGFIAEMRAEIERLRPFKAAAEQAGLHVADAGVSPVLAPHGARVEELARRFEDSGRIGLGPGEVARLERGLAGRAERTLFESSMEDLTSPDPRTRRRAAESLQAMQMRNAAPLVAAAVGREPDGEVKAALLSALAALAEPPAVEIAARELGDPRPVVRTAALEAMARLGGAGAEPRILEAFGDPSPAVRRRAVLLAGFFHNPATDEALAAALSDREPSVARAAALSLSGRPTPAAQAALTRALDHAFEPVRRVASETVARWSGEAVAAGAPGEDRRRAARRIAERLGRIEAEALRDAVVTAGPDAPPPAPLPLPAPASRGASYAARVEAPAAPAAPPVAREAAAPAPRARVAVAVVDEAAGELDEVEAAVLQEVRSALRGRTPEEIARLVPGPSDDALRSLVARGAVVRRGARYFPA